MNALPPSLICSSDKASDLFSIGSQRFFAEYMPSAIQALHGLRKVLSRRSTQNGGVDVVAPQQRREIRAHGCVGTKFLPEESRCFLDRVQQRDNGTSYVCNEAFTVMPSHPTTSKNRKPQRDLVHRDGNEIFLHHVLSSLLAGQNHVAAQKQRVGLS